MILHVTKIKRIKLQQIFEYVALLCQINEHGSKTPFEFRDTKLFPKSWNICADGLSITRPCSPHICTSFISANLLFISCPRSMCLWTRMSNAACYRESLQMWLWASGMLGDGLLLGFSRRYFNGISQALLVVVLVVGNITAKHKNTLYTQVTLKPSLFIYLFFQSAAFEFKVCKKYLHIFLYSFYQTKIYPHILYPASFQRQNLSFFASNTGGWKPHTHLSIPDPLFEFKYL